MWRCPRASFECVHRRSSEFCLRSLGKKVCFRKQSWLSPHSKFKTGFFAGANVQFDRLRELREERNRASEKGGRNTGWSDEIVPRLDLPKKSDSDGVHMSGMRRHLLRQPAKVVTFPFFRTPSELCCTGPLSFGDPTFGDSLCPVTLAFTNRHVREAMA